MTSYDGTDGRGSKHFEKYDMIILRLDCMVMVECLAFVTAHSEENIYDVP